MPTTPSTAVNQFDEAHMEQVLSLCDEFRQVIERRMPDFPNPSDAFGVGMAAAATFSGMLAGHLTVLGCYPETPEQQRLFAQMLMTNFPQGLQLGKIHAAQQIAILEGQVN